ncbi:MAG: tetratricopeptide repeat protein [Alphaproteobacteria bacterium]
MSDEDNIIREVEEDLRRERYERLWKKYGPFVIGIIVVVLVSMLGWQQYGAWQDRQRAQEAEAFLAAADLLEQGKGAAAAEAFAELAKDAGSGYRAVARFSEAEAHMDEGNPDEALAALDSLAADSSVNPGLRALAALKGGLLLADSASPEDLKKRLRPALRPGSPWRFAAQELVAYAYYRSGKPGEARNAYQALANEYDAPAHIRDRASSMLGLIASEKAQRAGEEPPAEGAQEGRTQETEEAPPALSGGGGPGADADEAETDKPQAGDGAGETAPAPGASADAGAEDGAEGETPR